MAAGDLETVFELATSVAAPLAGSRSGAILSLGRDGWRVDAQSGFAPPLDLSAIVELTSFFDRAVRDRGPVLVDHDLRLPGEGDGGAVLPLLVLPVAYGREVLGVFLFQADKSSRGAPTWTAEEWSRARIVTELTASAWKNARKYQELERTARGLERQLRESQKRELVGMLAGGIAHDFNNLLGGIVGSAALLRSQVGDSGAAAKYLETIQKAAHRGSALAGRLVAAVSTSSDVSDPPSTTRCLPFSPNEFVSDTLDLLSQTLPKKIHIERVLDERVPAITMDPGAFQQIILNLCVNARDAMPNGGRLSIETSVETSAGGSPDVFCLCVTDSGSGMDEITKKRLFEPFYTTKGTTSSGLGLSVVRDIVKSLDGSIEVESSVGHGARFLIKVPVATEMVEGDVETPTPTPTPKTLVSADARARLASTRELWNGEGEMILLVDDELVLLEIGRQILEEQGYRVKTASSGEDALRILRSERGTISLVILDLVMPGLDGYETYHEIRRKDEALPVLISSGMTSERTARELLEDGAAGFIPKPYDVSDLAEAVFEALHGRAPSLVH
jgi:signal transduction histidine kinase/CheY-like chemotaxis protein